MDINVDFPVTFDQVNEPIEVNVPAATLTTSPTAASAHVRKPVSESVYYLTLALAPIIIFVAWMAIPADMKYDDVKETDVPYFLFFLKLPCVSCLWVSVMISLSPEEEDTKFGASKMTTIRNVALIVFAGIFHSVSTYIGLYVIAPSLQPYRSWIPIVCLVITIVFVGFIHILLQPGESRRHCLFVMLSILFLGVQLAFSMVFGLVLFPKMSTWWQRALLCSSYPIGIKIVQVFREKSDLITKEDFFGICAAQCFASFPYRMIFPAFAANEDWGGMCAIFGVEILFKFLAYTIPQLPAVVEKMHNRLVEQLQEQEMTATTTSGTTTDTRPFAELTEATNGTTTEAPGLAVAPADETPSRTTDGPTTTLGTTAPKIPTLSEYQLYCRSHLAAKFMFHQFCDGSNAVASMLVFSMVARIPLHSFGDQFDGLGVLVEMYAVGLGVEILISGFVYVMLAKGYVDREQFDPTKHFMKFAGRKHIVISMALAISYVTPMLYVEMYSF
eukprot:PhF_6_TR611/c1_g1_i4/m.779